MAIAHRPHSPSTPPYTGAPTPDRRLASSFVRRRPHDTAAEGLRIGIVSAYAPSTGPSARHARLLLDGLRSPDLSVCIVRAGQSTGTPSDGMEIVYDLTTEPDADEEAAAKVLNRLDLVLIEHEFGVYGGLDGDQVLKLLNWLCVPTVIVAHTIPAHPSAAQHAVLADLVRSADAVVASGQHDREHLHQAYGASLRKVLVIDDDATAARYRHLIDALLRRPQSRA